jgi:hypothetical protein
MVAAAIGPSDRVATYGVPEGEFATGSPLGGPKVCLAIKATGAVEKLFSVDLGEDLFGTLLVDYCDEDTGARLRAQAGTFTLHPEHPEHVFTFDNGIEVAEDVFVLSSRPVGADQTDPPAAYYTVRVRNGGEGGRRLATYAYCQLGGPTPQAASDRTMAAAYHDPIGALLAWDRAHAGLVRVFGCSLRPTSFETTDDEGVAEAERYRGDLSGQTAAGGVNPLGVLHHRHEIEPGGEVSYSYLLSFSGNGQTEALATYRASPAAADALLATCRHYHNVLSQAVLLSPNPQVNHGVLWAKANMLRVQSQTPLGWTFTNNPTHSSKAVGRDAAWFAMGGDYLVPRFSRETLLGFVRRQEPSGMIIEDYDFRRGETADDGLNINDNTPLLILALWHHYCATGDRDFLRDIYPAMARAARYIISQENQHGLVWCTATGTGGKGVIGWRNVVQGYRLSGGTIEVNAECHGALKAAAHMAALLGNGEEGRAFESAATALRTAINRHLFNPENGLYYRNIDIDGRPRSEVTSDLVFPLLFGVATADTATRIVQRLSAADFWTSVGIRTAPRTAVSYSAEHGSGLLGGV